MDNRTGFENQRSEGLHRFESCTLRKMKDKLLLVAAPIVFKKSKDKKFWFIAKVTEESDWEIPKATAKRGESSVRAAIRSMAEQGGMNTKVLEEVGRAGGAAMMNGKTLPQRYLFYLMVRQEGSGEETLEFADSVWLEYGQAIRKLSQKRDQMMLRDANALLKKLERDKKRIF